MSGKSEKGRSLLALDGSDDAFETVRYVSKIGALKSRQIVLFTVFSKIRDSYWDLEKEPVYSQKLGEIRAWETQRGKTLEEYMEKARRVLLDAGFPETSVDVRYHEKKEGVARDILTEAGQGYEALVIGRRGVSKIKGIVLGSVAAKILDKTTSLPLLMVGKDVRPRKILIGLDGSDGSRKAVDCTAAMFGGPDCHINLTNVVRDEESDRIAAAEKMIAAAFDEAIDRLVSSGVPLNQINTQIITGAQSRAETIVREAEQGGYGTITVGKRGFSEVRDFLMGSVSYKVVQLARERTVLVVT